MTFVRRQEDKRGPDGTVGALDVCDTPVFDVERVDDGLLHSGFEILQPDLGDDGVVICVEHYQYWKENGNIYLIILSVKNSRSKK